MFTQFREAVSLSWQRVGMQPGFCYLLERGLCYDGEVREFQSWAQRKTDDDLEHFDASQRLLSCSS